MTNRLFSHFAALQSSCPCCEAERRAAVWRDAAEEIEDALHGPFDDGDKLIEVVYPSLSSIIEEDFDDLQLQFWPSRGMFPEPTASVAGAAAHLAYEFRRIAAELCEAAAVLERGAAQ